VFQGGLAIGITGNFENTKTKDETALREFGLMSVYDQEFFKKLEQDNIELENLVYYRGETRL